MRLIFVCAFLLLATPAIAQTEDFAKANEIVSKVEIAPVGDVWSVTVTMQDGTVSKLTSPTFLQAFMTAQQYVGAVLMQQ